MGYCYGEDIYSKGYGGFYWTSSLDNKYTAWSLHLFSDEVCIYNNHHECNQLVHLISDTPCDGYIDMGTGIYWALENYKDGEKIYFTWNEAMAILQKINGGKVECSYPNYNLLNLNQNSIACTHVPEEPSLTISKSIPIDWKQRRYEIAKVILLRLSKDRGPEFSAQQAVKYADEFIKQLKR